MDEEEHLFDPRYLINYQTFDFCGPFYVACDHRCAHGTANHGVGASGDHAGCVSGFWGDDYSTPRRVFEVNRQRVARADIVFAFIDSCDCHGTLVELGLATQLGKRIAVAFGNNLSPKAIRDLWMARMCANAGLYAHTDVRFVWRSFLYAQGLAPKPPYLLAVSAAV